MTPGQIVAILAEEGVWLGSERTLYRILKTRKALESRTESRRPVTSKKPPELVASGPNQVWSWDITWLRTDVAGIFVFAYVVIDIFSRKVVGWTIEANESDAHAAQLFKRIIRDTGVCPRFVHADNGSPMKGLSLVSFLTRMQVGLTYSRPRISDDNPFIESFFKTLKYTVGYPKAFTGLNEARTWFANFVDWYNTSHRHSGIDFVTPEMRHTGDDIRLLAARNATRQAAFEKHRNRFVRGLKTYSIPIQPVTLNKSA